MALSATDIDAAIAVVEDTALLQACNKGGERFITGLVLLYPTSVEPFHSETAEWVVMISCGWIYME